MKTEEDRDLTPLSPKLDAERWARLAAAIEAAAAPELSRRASTPEPALLMLLSSWARPAFATAGGMAAAAALLLALEPRAEAELVPGVAEGLGFPTTVALWIEAGWTPSVEELLVTINGEER